jgi:branched-chain amino acid transport system ATP-binding protein
MLVLDGMSAGYGRLTVLHAVSLRVDVGEIVALVGANGAGKTTLLRAVSGLRPVISGSLSLDGESLDGVAPHERVKRGLVQVPEGRELFGALTVAENLEMGGWSRTAPQRKESLEQVLELFPILAERRQQVAETMSGGQQQMLAIGRALMSGPRLLMLDEPSIGLSPKFVELVLAAAVQIRDTGVTVLLVEQNVAQALEIADRAYVLESGDMVLDGPGKELLTDPRVRTAYLGA